MIKRTAPGYGVPAWFALRIAKVESGYNPRARGAAGEYGVFQLKCSTARSIGYSGTCGGLLNASTNVKYGLKHLSLAVKSSRGNLKLAASKHNGGLGRKRLVRQYVALVF
jgi:soluble lytic murein transglycosylase-like protein